MRTATGGWQGTGHESHLELLPEENALVEAAHQRAAQAQPGLDTMMQRVETATASYGGRLEGRDHSLKSVDSFQSKVARAAYEDPGRDRADVVADKAANTRDLNRYTLTYPTDQYAAGVDAGYQQLRDHGYEEMPGTHKNTWNQPDYKGLNTSWQHHETGQRLEVQFHTPESFQAKEDNHLVYELDRSGSLSDDERDAAVHVQAERYEDVPIPADHERFGTQQPAKELPETSEEAVQQVRDKEQALAAETQAEPTLAAEKQAEPGTAALDQTERGQPERTERQQTEQDPTSTAEAADANQTSETGAAGQAAAEESAATESTTPSSSQPATTQSEPATTDYSQHAASDDARVADAMESGEHTGQHGHDAAGYEPESTTGIGRE